MEIHSFSLGGNAIVKSDNKEIRESRSWFFAITKRFTEEGAVFLLCSRNGKPLEKAASSNRSCAAGREVQQGLACRTRARLDNPRGGWQHRLEDRDLRGLGTVRNVRYDVISGIFRVGRLDSNTYSQHRNRPIDAGPGATAKSLVDGTFR